MVETEAELCEPCYRGHIGDCNRGDCICQSPDCVEEREFMRHISDPYPQPVWDWHDPALD